MASKLLLVVVFVFNLIAFALFMVTEQRRTKPLCHEDEGLALLQFKESLMIASFASVDPSAYAKVSFWEPKSSDCCGWHGVKCDEDTGHVVSLDLNSSYLFGPINSNNSLFQLVHLQSLNLSDNDFSYSQIPTSFRHLSRLTSLNLHSARFSGQIPLEILELSKLVFLDISGYQLELPELGLKKMTQNLTNLKELHLSEVNISSTIPKTLANLSSLTSLFLDDCGLHGQFPIEILHLPNLQLIDVSYNWVLNGSIPEFNQSNFLESLELSSTSFLGKLSDSMSNLKSLQHVGVLGCNFFGQIPFSFGNLALLVSLQLSQNRFHGEFPIEIFHLPNLQFIDVSHNRDLKGSIPEFNHSNPLRLLELSYTSFFGKLPNSIRKLKSLQHVGIAKCNFYGPIPSSLENLKSLSTFIAKGCNFSGPIPSSLGNLTQLNELDLGQNNLHGSIPKSISKLVNLEHLILDSNYLSGTMELDLFLKLKNLYWLDLSKNNISLLTKPSTNTTFQKFVTLVLSYCHLHEFPDFLRNQNQLRMLDLSWNEIHGQVSKPIWDAIKDTSRSLDLSFNFLTGFDGLPVFSLHSHLQYLSLDSNKLQGPLPIPPPSILWYSAANNTLTGEISHWICDISYISGLDLSSNNISGSLPQCLGNFSDYLVVLNLHKNNFLGTIPQSFAKGNELKMIDLSQNQLRGPIPRALANCTKLEVLNLGDNQIKDSFPFWLGALSELKVLILRSNRFYGPIGNPHIHFDFPSLRVVDLSNNEITGELPSQYFQTWKAMEILNETNLKYMQTLSYMGYYNYSMTFINKGENMDYARILDFFMAIDLSNNRFEGEIPKAVAHLKGLKLLNLSNNFLIGHIPSSLGNLTEVESLDLSQNKLSGAIPSQLLQLNFLVFFNVSHNHLTGVIPSGNQFNTFPNTSFSDNLGLCGSPLSKKCKNFEHSNSPTSTFGDNETWRTLFEFNWKVVVMGYGCGFVVGIVLGITKKLDWLIKTFTIGQPTRRSMNWRQHRS